MWSDTMTIYREIDGKVERTIVRNCRFEPEMELTSNILGDGRQEKCFLAVPAGVELRPGDRVAAGEGPDLPSTDAVRLTTVRPRYLHGSLHHTEALG